MLSKANRIKLSGILERLSKGKTVSLQERFFLSKLSNNDQSVSNLSRKAVKKVTSTSSVDSIDKFLNELNLGPSEPHEEYDPKNDDLGEWFCGSPSWIARS